MNLAPEEREIVFQEELAKRKRIERLTSEERENIFQQELKKRQNHLNYENPQLKTKETILFYDSSGKTSTTTYKDTDLIAPPLRSAVTGTIGGIWFFGMLFMFGFVGLIWAVIIAFIAFLMLGFGTSWGYLPTEWTTPYFMASCPKCHINFPYFLNDSVDEYHPEQDHEHNVTCDECENPFTLNYKYTGRYDAKWDKLR